MLFNRKRRGGGKRSPLKDPPLRNPGQSLDEELQRILDDKVNSYVLVAVITIVFAAMEWWRWYRPSLPEPLVLSLFAVAISGYAAFRLFQLKKKIAGLKLGRDGEKAVGQTLEALREKGYSVFHDIVGAGFNVDHVILSTRGIYCIETKTFNKPKDRDAKIFYDGKKITVDGRTLDRDPIVQSKAAANWLKQMLLDSTGKSYRVRPVVVFPGWFIESAAHPGDSDVWVLEPKALPAFIENQKPVFQLEDVKLATYHLSRYIRTTR